MARLSRTLELEVRRRAAGRCEYCLFPDSASELPFHIDHIIAQKHGGQSESENLAWACFSCNVRKGPNIRPITDARKLKRSTDEAAVPDVCKHPADAERVRRMLANALEDLAILKFDAEAHSASTEFDS